MTRWKAKFQGTFNQLLSPIAVARNVGHSVRLTCQGNGYEKKLVDRSPDHQRVPFGRHEAQKRDPARLMLGKRKRKLCPNCYFRGECLSLEWFRTRLEAKVVIEQWRRHYNGIRPHSSLAYLAPNEFKQRYCSTEAIEAVRQD